MSCRCKKSELFHQQFASITVRNRELNKLLLLKQDTFVLTTIATCNFNISNCVSIQIYTNNNPKFVCTTSIFFKIVNLHVIEVTMLHVCFGWYQNKSQVFLLSFVSLRACSGSKIWKHWWTINYVTIKRDVNHYLQIFRANNTKLS